MTEGVPKLALDCTVPLLREGYPFISRRCRRFHSDVFRGRLLGKPALFVTGAEAAELFYDERRFRRVDAVPGLIKKTLFGVGGVQGLDDDAHRRRKAMFMSLMTKAQIARFLALGQQAWDEAVARFQARERVVLDDEAQLLYGRVALAWAGVPVAAEAEATRIVRDCSLLFTSFTNVGPRMWKARLARKRVEAWARGVIERVRAGELNPDAGSAARVIAEHRDLGGELLPADVAAVELVNIIRPITAIGRWVAWLGLALRDHPAYVERVREDAALLEGFVQEVRRFYPFTPLLGARVRETFAWQGTIFHEGELVVLDVYGTLRDPRLWDAPDEFMPARFVGIEPGAYQFLPHGGGEFLSGHRCAGEWLAIEGMKQALRFLTTQVTYVVPAQDLSYALDEIPARPKSGVILANIQPRAGAPTDVESADVRGLDGTPTVSA